MPTAVVHLNRFIVCGIVREPEHTHIFRYRYGDVRSAEAMMNADIWCQREADGVRWDLKACLSSKELAKLFYEEMIVLYIRLHDRYPWQK